MDIAIAAYYGVSQEEGPKMRVEREGLAATEEASQRVGGSAIGAVTSEGPGFISGALTQLEFIFQMASQVIIAQQSVLATHSVMPVYFAGTRRMRRPGRHRRGVAARLR